MTRKQQVIMVSARNHTCGRLMSMTSGTGWRLGSPIDGFDTPAVRNPGTCEEGWAILRGIPDNPARYHSLTVARYRRWVQRLTPRQYILFTGVISFAVAAVVGAVTAPFLGPFSWSGVAVLAVLMTAFWTWYRRDELRQGKEYPGAGPKCARGPRCPALPLISSR
jgi:hypothetical protein